MNADELIKEIERRVLEYDDLSKNAISNQEYFKGKLEAYKWVNEHLKESITELRRRFDIEIQDIIDQQ